MFCNDHYLNVQWGAVHLRIFCFVLSAPIKVTQTHNCCTYTPHCDLRTLTCLGPESVPMPPFLALALTDATHCLQLCCTIQETHLCLLYPCQSVFLHSCSCIRTNWPRFARGGGLKLAPIAIQPAYSVNTYGAIQIYSTRSPRSLFLSDSFSFPTALISNPFSVSHSIAITFMWISPYLFPAIRFQWGQGRWATMRGPSSVGCFEVGWNAKTLAISLQMPHSTVSTVLSK